ncbi:hypothetical protein ATI02_2028 [Pseudomonas baetica]|uniref:Uncharacterized protein n=2 Tax=Pseudomonas baetica TaxID=674054 RepID=A0ABX4PVZ3_9PSED|nr:hypothetical protein ATI02_2028 [Pseudomonas baetica]
MSLWQAHLFFSLALFLVAAPLTQSLKWRLVMLASASALSFVSHNGLSLAAYVRSFTDDLAITTTIVLVWLTLQRLGMKLPGTARPGAVVVIVFAALALFLYPATLGLSYSDPYRLGFNPHPLIIAVATIAFGLLYLRNGLGVVMLAGATLAFAVRTKPSENYWDYLIDPLLALYCCVALVVMVMRGIYRRWRSRQPLTLSNGKPVSGL